MPAHPEPPQKFMWGDLGFFVRAAPFPATSTPAHPERRQNFMWGDGAFFVRAAPFCGIRSCLTSGPPSSAVAACYSRQELCEAGYELSRAEAYGYSAALERSWLSVTTGENAGGVMDVSRESYHALISGCMIRGSGHGEVFLRIERRRDGTGIARAEVRDGLVEPDLLCCLREAQSTLVRALRPGTARALMVRFGGQHGFEVTSF